MAEVKNHGKLFTASALFIIALWTLICAKTEVNIDVPGLSQQTNSAGTSYPTAYVGEVFRLEINVHGGDQSTGEAHLEDLNELNKKHYVVYRGTSTKVTMINGQYALNKTYTYNVQPTQAGLLSIGPAHVKHGKDRLSSPKIVINVVPAEEKKRHAQASQQQVQTQPVPSRTKTDVFCKLIPHKKEVFVGEPMQVSLVCYVHGAAIQLQISTPPQFQGFIISKSDTHARRYRETVKGKEYDIFEYRYTLIPRKVGQTTLEPVVLDYAIPVQNHQRRGGLFEEFFGGVFDSVQQKQAQSDPVTISIKDLPAHKEKVDGVGQFSNFTVSADTTTVHTNQPIKVTVEITGTGNIEYINDLEFVVPKGCKVYKSKTSFEENTDAGLSSGTKTFEFILQCSKPGTITIPAQRFIYFDPTDEKYKKLESDELTLSIEQRDDEPLATSPSASKNTVPHQTDQTTHAAAATESEAEQKEDIHFIDEDIPLSYHPPRALPFWFFIIIMLSITFLMLIGNPLMKKILLKVRYAAQGDISLSQALVQANKDLETAIQQEKSSQLHHIFMGIISLLVGISRNEVREDQIEAVLCAKGWDKDKIHAFVMFINQCAHLQFGASNNVAHARHEQQELFKKARYWMLLLSQ